MSTEERLYLACYIVETETEETIPVPGAAPRVKKSPYFDENGNSLSGEELKKVVLLRENPQFIVSLEAEPPSIPDPVETLKNILGSLNFDAEKDRWCWLSEKRFGIVLFYILRESDFPTATRSRTISHAYGSADFYPRYFLEKFKRSSLCTQYFPPTAPDTGGVSTNGLRRRILSIDPSEEERIRNEMVQTPSEAEIKEFLKRLKELSRESDDGDEGKQFF